MTNDMPAPDAETSELTGVLHGLLDQARGSGRDDLVDRLDPWLHRLDRPQVRIVVVGPFKRGKSSLVNAIVGAAVCPIDDFYATAVPTIIGYGPEPSARLVADVPGELEPMSVPIDINALRRHVTDNGMTGGALESARVEVTLPQQLLRDGLVLVDTPGIGGPVARHAATTLALLPDADALLVLTDASQEFTEPELAFLRQAAAVCPNVYCVLSKVDLEPHWREVADANRRHLETAGIDAPVLPVSTLLHQSARATNDEQLAMESGIPALIEMLTGDLRRSAVSTLRQAAARDAESVSKHLAMTLQAELESLVGPGEAAALIQTLEEAQKAAADLSKRASRWQVLLNDGFSDILADIEYDIRDRIRAVGREAELLVDESDPADTWETLNQWIADALAQAIADSFVWAHQRCERLATVVAESFRLEGDVLIPQFSAIDTSDMLAPVIGLDMVRATRMTGTQKVVGALRGSYSGILMTGIVTSLAGMALINPISLAAGALLGGFSLRQEGVTRLERRRSEARMSVRRLIDDTNFHVLKESRTRLLDVKRLMRDTFEGAAEEFRRSLQESLDSAKRGAQTAPPQRDERTYVLKDQLTSVRQFGARAEALGGMDDA
jgi:predicted GTPase